MVKELYARPVILEPMIDTVVPAIHVDSIWAIPDPLGRLEKRLKRREKR